MQLAEFLSQCLALDLEARGDRIYRIGALCGEVRFERGGRFDAARALAELDRLAEGRRYLIGHNLLGFDLPLLQRLYPDLQLLRKGVIDTLYLSPLAFPENPYHRLVKDYKLVKDSLNDPVADARLAVTLFQDQWRSFAEYARTHRTDVLSLYRYCLERGNLAANLNADGLEQVFNSLGAYPITEEEVWTVFQALSQDRSCQTALAELAADLQHNPQDWPALAYAAAWLQVAGSNSVLPPWVRHRFPKIPGLLHQLRDVACQDPDCSYCRTIHDPTRQLRRYFDFPSFRPSPGQDPAEKSLQETIVTLGMGEKPLLAILPTGGGKSLCYQLPALVRHFRRGQLTIVISPLQALMKDQVDNLTEKTGAPSAAALNGLLTPPERGDVLERVRLGDIAILYVAPEQLRNTSFAKTITQREIGCWVFNEAHCLSKWGHDFRPDYLYAGLFRYRRPSVRHQGQDRRGVAGARRIPQPQPEQHSRLSGPAAGAKHGRGTAADRRPEALQAPAATLAGDSAGTDERRIGSGPEHR